MGRPSTPSTKYFQRTLSDPEKQIMLAAGEGNLCRGFENMLTLYQYAHNHGYRPTMDMSILNIRSGTIDNPNDDDLSVGNIRIDTVDG